MKRKWETQTNNTQITNRYPSKKKGKKKGGYTASAHLRSLSLTTHPSIHPSVLRLHGIHIYYPLLFFFFQPRARSRLLPCVDPLERLQAYFWLYKKRHAGTTVSVTRGGRQCGGGILSIGNHLLTNYISQLLCRLCLGQGEGR